MKIFLLFLLVSAQISAQHFVDLTDKLSNIQRAVIINGNDYSLNEQVIVTTNSINFVKPAYVTFYNVLLNVQTKINGKGKMKLEGSSRMYVKYNGGEPSSKLVSKKPFGEEILFEKCNITKGVAIGAKYTIWHINGTVYKKGILGDGTKVKRMYYTVKLDKRFLDKQLLTD